MLEGTAGNEGVARGAYVLRATDGDPDIVLIGTGSEVPALRGRGRDRSPPRASPPAWCRCRAGTSSTPRTTPTRCRCCGVDVPTVSVEAGATFGWARYADASVGIDRFGACAPGGVVMEKFGITPANVVEHARALLAAR